MADLAPVIGITIDSSGARSGATSVIAEYNRIITGARQVSAANDNIRESLDNFGRGARGAASGAGRASSALDEIMSRAASAIPVVGGLTSNMVALGATAGLIIGVGAALATAAKSAAHYQDVLAKISTNVDTTTFSMDALSAGILRQSAAFGGMPVAQAEAAYDIISAGAGSAAQALDILNASNQLAVGGMTSVGVAADGLTSVINAYGADVLTTAAASDAMFISARDGKTTIDQLSSSLGNVAPLAAAVGVSFDEVTGAIGVLTKGGINTSESVTGLKAILSSISKPSEEAKKAAKSLGLEFNVAGLKAKGLKDFLQEVADKTGNSASKMATLFGGVEALVPALALTSKGGRDFSATMDNMANKAGATAAAVQKMQDGSPSFQWSRVVASATAELIKIGNAIASAALPGLRLLADNMENIFRVGKAAAIGLAVFGAAAVGMKVATAVGQVLALQRALGATGTFSALFGVGMKIAQSAVNGLTAALAANPFTATAVAITATIALLYQFRDSIMISSDGITSLGDFFRAVFESVGPAISSAVSTITSALSGVWSSIKSIFGGVGSFIYSAFSGPLDAVSGLFKSTFGDLDFTFEGVLIGAARVADGIVGVFRGSFNALVALWNGLPAALGPNIMSIITGAKNLVVGLAGAIGNIWKGLVSFGQSAVAMISSAFNSVASFIERWANKAISALNSVIAGANKLGAGLAPLAEITIGKVAAPKAEAAGFTKLGADMAAGFNSGFGNTFEKGVTGLLGRARAIGAGRTGAGASGSAASAGTRGVVDDSGFADAGKGGGAGAAASAVEKLGEKIEEFWKKLEGEGKDADALWKALQAAAAQGKNLAVVSADISKELEFQRLVGRDINAAERERLSTAMQQGRTAKFFSDQLVKSAERGMNLGQQEQLLKLRQSGVSEEQLKIEKAVLENREGALKAGVDLTSEAFKANEAALRIDLQREQAIGRQNEKLDEQVQLMKEAASNGASYARTAMRDFGTVAERRKAAETENSKILESLRAARDSTGKDKISSEEFEAGTRRAGEELQERFREIGDEFSNKMNRAADLLGDIGAAIGGKGGKAISGLSNIARGIGGFNDTKDLITEDFKKIFGEKSELVKGIGGAVGGAMAGLKIGESIADLGKVFGANKGFQKGAKIGGAVGGLTGNPAIAAGASVIGGIIGGLLYKPKFGTAQLTGSGDPVITGRGAKQKAAASGAAGSVQEALAGIAAELGGQIGNYMVSIGTYKDKWRVSTSGSTGKLKTSRGAVDFGDDQGAAIAFAVEDAIKDGAITGLSDVVQKALKGLGTDSAIQFAKDWNAVMDDFKALTDPVGAAIESITKPLDTLRNTMLSIGASSTDLAKLEEYRSLKMKEVLEEQTSGFRDLLKNLNGDGGGVTALNQLTRNMSEFDKFRSDIAAGKTVDQSKFTDLANSILSGANSVYGTNTKDFQNIVSMLKDATNGAIGLVEAQFNPAQAAQAQIDAMKAASDAAVAEAAISNDYLSQILTAIQLNGVIAGAIGGGGRGEVWGGAPNGRIINAY